MSKSLTSSPAQVPRSRSIMSLGRSLAPSAEGYFLGVDGGGTKTHAVITTADCRVIAEGVSGPSNPLRVGLDEAVSHVEQAVAEACGRAAVRVQDISSACVALAGVNHPIHYHTVKEALDHTLAVGHLHLVTDVRAALAGALDGQAGVVLIAGTGSIAMGVSASGEEARSGGWGPTLGDEGSGYDIARRALKAVASSFDGRSPRTALTDRVCRRLGIATTADLPGVIYNSCSEAVEIASLAELVAEAASEGDEVARDILAQAGAELGHLAASVVARLGMQGDAFRVACVGSVFRSGKYVLDPVKEAVLRVAPRAELGPPLFPPTVGAAKLAQGLDVRC